MRYIEKYQPQNLNQVLYPNLAVEQLVKSVAANSTSSNLILFGPMGTGKSLLAQLIAEELASKRIVDVEVFQGTQLRTAAKADDLIQRIEKQRFLYNVFADRRMYIIEEFDRVPLESQLGFGHLLTTPDLQFILTTNSVSDIDARLVSRALPCKVTGATQQDMEQLVQRVLSNEGVSATPTEVAKLITSVNGNVRDLMNGLEVLVLQKRLQSVPAVPQPVAPVAPQPVAQAVQQPPVQPLPPASLAVTVTPPQQPAPSAQPTP